MTTRWDITVVANTYDMRRIMHKVAGVALPLTGRTFRAEVTDTLAGGKLVAAWDISGDLAAGETVLEMEPAVSGLLRPARSHAYWWAFEQTVETGRPVQLIHGQVTVIPRIVTP